MGPKTHAARRAFRRRYNDELSGSLPLDAETTSADDWKAFFDLFEQGLTDELGDDLESCRGALSISQPPISWLVARTSPEAGNRPTGMRSASDRRVDMLFLDPSRPYPDLLWQDPSREFDLWTGTDRQAHATFRRSAGDNSQ